MTRNDRAISLLYVNGTHEGGSLMSTALLLERLAAQGHRVTLLQQSKEHDLQRRAYKRMTNLEVHTGGRVGSGPLTPVARRIGRRVGRFRSTSFLRLSAPVVENAAAGLLSESRFDIVVASSLSRVAWLRLRAMCRDRGLPCILYLREDSLLPHLDLGADPDLVLANSPSLTSAAERLGFPARFIPSVVEVAESNVTSSFETMLVINPSPAYGVELAIELAAAVPNVPFVMQESTELSVDRWSHLRERTKMLPNLELRHHTTDLKSVYKDARVLLVPYDQSLRSCRPRVILEAQHNGIPVLASDLAGLRDCVGDGGRFVDANAGVDAWGRELHAMWQPDMHCQLSAQAKRHAARDEMQPAVITAQFIAALNASLT